MARMRTVVGVQLDLTRAPRVLYFSLRTQLANSANLLCSYHFYTTDRDPTRVVHERNLGMCLPSAQPST